MTDLGRRLYEDKRKIRDKREEADRLERKVRDLRREADEIERLMEQARLNA